jgi:beta-glucosidase-like glycosyl hydrolase
VLGRMSRLIPGTSHPPALPRRPARAWRPAPCRPGSGPCVSTDQEDFAPDADVVGGADNTVIGSRSFGADPTAVSAQVGAAVQSLQSAGVAASPKHFPGHGHTGTDSHQALPALAQSRAQLDAQDLPPFRAAIGAGSWLIMAGPA